jgi:hypothetical protein
MKLRTWRARRTKANGALERRGRRDIREKLARSEGKKRSYRLEEVEREGWVEGVDSDRSLISAELAARLEGGGCGRG